MVGLVVASHGRLADELVHTAEQIVGTLPAVATCSIEPGTSVEDLRAQMRQAIARVDEGEGVIVMADLFGGSRSEARRKIAQGGVRLDGERVAADVLDLPGEALDGRVLQVGKRQFRRLRVA